MSVFKKYFYTFLFILLNCISITASPTSIHPLMEHDQLDKSFSGTLYTKTLYASSVENDHFIEKPNNKRFKPMAQISAKNELIKKGSLPNFMDLTMFAIILDQDNLGSCAANCAAQAVRVAKTIQLMNIQPSLSVLEAKGQVHTLSRLYNYYYARQHDMRGTQNFMQRDCGTSLASALWSLHYQGAPNEEEWPYDVTKFNEMPPKQIDKHAKHNQVLSDFYSKTIQNRDLYSIKNALSQGFPILASIRFKKRNYQDGYLKIPTRPQTKSKQNHAVTILGYDDQDQTNGYKGHFVAANCWGTNWGLKSHGQRGFFKIPYEFIQNDRLTGEIWYIEAVSLSDIIKSPAVKPKFKLENIKEDSHENLH